LHYNRTQFVTSSYTDSIHVSVDLHVWIYWAKAGQGQKGQENVPYSVSQFCLQTKMSNTSVDKLPSLRRTLKYS